MKFLIVTGLSGAGKTSVLRHLEDSGYQCMDNIPPLLLAPAFTLCEKVELDTPVALGVDSRSGALFDADTVCSAIDQGGDSHEISILFLEADTETLIDRYKETRRDHPLMRGGITLEQLRSVLGEVDVDRALYEKIGDDVKVSAPGMKYRHYAPKAPVTVVRGDPAQTAAYIAQHIGEKTGVMCFHEYRDCFPGCVVECFGSENDLGTQAREVFDRLRAFDDTDVRQIWAQCPSDEGLGLAVANRIKKAAGFSVVEV